MARFRVEQHRPRIIAPRLANGDKRIGFGHGLPPQVKEGIRRIAERANKSMSWVMEEVIVEYFELRTPQYLPRKTMAPPGPPEVNVPPAKTTKQPKQQQEKK